MEIEIDIKSAYKIMSTLILADILLYRERLEDTSMLNFISMSEDKQQDILKTSHHLAILELVAPLYCGENWQSKI